MSFVVTHRPSVPVVSKIACGLVALRVVDSWSIDDADGTDDEDMHVAVVLAPAHLAGTASVYADRIAELLNRHGLVDVPDEVPS